MKELQKSLFDFHLHTERSPDASSTPEQIIEAAKKKRLAGFIKSDHDSNRKDDFKKLHDLAAEQDLIVIPGAEITCLPPTMKPVRPTLEIPQLVRHVIVAGVPPEKNIPLFRRTPQMIAKWAHDEGGIIIAAHPKKNGGASSLSQKEIFDLAEHLDGLEVANPLGIHYETIAWAEELNLAQIGGSDAHKPHTIGLAATELPGSYTNWEEVIDAVRDKKASAYIAHDFYEQTNKKGFRTELWRWTTEKVL